MRDAPTAMIFGLFKQRKRQRLRARPFPPAWKSIITRNVPIFRRLPPADQTELLGCVQIFLAEKHFEGCGGLELTDEIRVTIAAQACLLLLHRETDYYPELTSILVYPSGYLAREDRYLGDDIWEQGEDGRSVTPAVKWVARAGVGRSETRRSRSRGRRNLVLHEFAHQLDFEDSQTDGAPALSTRNEYLAWARVMSREFEALVTQPTRQRPLFLIPMAQ